MKYANLFVYFVFLSLGYLLAGIGQQATQPSHAVQAAGLFLVIGLLVGALIQAVILKDRIYRLNSGKKLFFLPGSEEYGEQVCFAVVSDEEAREISKEGVIPEDIVPRDRIFFLKKIS